MDPRRDEGKQDERAEKRARIPNDQCVGAGCNRQQKANCSQSMCRTCCAKTEQECFEHSSTPSQSSKPKIREHRKIPKIVNGTSESLVGRTCRGKLEGAFEHGHFVSVDVNGMILKGIVFKDNQKVRKIRRLSPSVARSLTERPLSNTKKRKRRTGEDKSGPSTKKKSKKSKKDEKKKNPKHPLNAYHFFVSKWRPILMAENPSKSFREIAQMVGDRWQNITPEEKLPFEKLAEVDRKRFEEEKAKMDGAKPKTKSTDLVADPHDSDSSYTE